MRLLTFQFQKVYRGW